MKLAESFQIPVILKLSKFFVDQCPDKSTITEVIRIAENEALWSTGHDLFTRIRLKNLELDKKIIRQFGIRRSQILECQYLFEEVCAKTIYNLSKMPAPFDSDSPDWIIPNAIILGQTLGIQEDEIHSIAGTRIVK